MDIPTGQPGERYGKICTFSNNRFVFKHHTIIRYTTYHAIYCSIFFIIYHTMYHTVYYTNKLKFKNDKSRRWWISKWCSICSSCWNFSIDYADIWIGMVVPRTRTSPPSGQTSFKFQCIANVFTTYDTIYSRTYRKGSHSTRGGIN